MTDLNAPYDATERDALAWRMLEERLEMAGVDLEALLHLKRLCQRPMSVATVEDTCVADVLGAVYDALAYRRQS